MSKITWLVLGVCLTVGCLGSTLVPGNAWGQSVQTVGQQERQELLDKAVTPFLKALQAGDTQMLEQLIGGKLALTLGKLLRENTEYPNFLRQRYGDKTVSAPIQIVRHQETSSQPGSKGGQRQAVVQLQTREGRADHFRLTLEQDPQGAWKITDKVRDH